jgi:hypothetical protein
MFVHPLSKLSIFDLLWLKNGKTEFFGPDLHRRLSQLHSTSSGTIRLADDPDHLGDLG